MKKKIQVSIYTIVMGMSLILANSCTEELNTSTNDYELKKAKLYHPGPVVHDIDGNNYNSVVIGTQVWMAENLKVTHYRNGDAIPNVVNTLDWASLVSGAYCDWDNTPANGTTYGHLYNFYTVLDSRQLCPTGWHVPSFTEWTTLTDYLGGVLVAGGKMKEVGLTHWASPNTGATNSSGFTALGGSWRGGDGLFYYFLGWSAWWWTSTEQGDAANPFSIAVVADAAYVSVNSDSYHTKAAGNSIRCIKDLKIKN